MLSVPLIAARGQAGGDRAAIQTQINGWGGAGGGVVRIDGTRLLDGPLLVRADRITLRGDGKLTGKAPYVGPLVVVGPATADPIDRSHYPPSILDASAPGRVGLATGGTHSVVFGPDGLTLGCAGGGLPGYYSDLDALTYETCIAVPPGVTLPPWTGLEGMADGSKPDPFALCTADDAKTWAFMYTTADGQAVAVRFPVDPTITHRLVVQADFKNGVISIWDNGRKLATNAPPLPPGSRLRRASGLTPFGVGFTNSAAPLQQPVANIILYGLKLTAGARYDSAKDVQTLLVGATSNDYASYGHELWGDPPIIAWLPLTGPGVANGTEPISYPNGNGVGLWCPSARSGVPSYIRIEGLTLRGNICHPTILLGEYMYARFSDLDARFGLQAIGSVMVSAAERYTLSITDCNVGGIDSVYSLSNTIYSTDRTNVSSSGITAVRESGCTSTHRTFFHPTSSAYQDTIFDLRGCLTRITDAIVDDENGGMGLRKDGPVPGQGGAYIRGTQGFGQPCRLVVDGFDVALGSVPLLDLVGLGDPQAGGGWVTTRIDARNFSVFGFQTGQPPTVLRVSGPPAAFAGTFDAGGLSKAGVAGATAVKMVH